MTVRLKDIASDLNLSKMTISKVLRGQTDVSAETKARVLQRMRELNYRPNISARSLRTGSSYSIGLVLPTLADHFFAEVAKGLVETVRAEGYGVLISSSEGDAEIERQEIELQLSRQADALIVAPVQESSEFFTALGEQKAPLILIDRKLPAFTSHFVGLRDQDIGYAAAEHLIQVGCRRVAYLRGPRTVSGDLRYSGYLAALHEFSMPFRPGLVIEAGDMACPEYQRGRDAIGRMLTRSGRPDGVMCYSDLLAVGVIDGALETGLRVPDDVAVVGCGNLPSTRELRVPLSSVDLSGYEVGQRTAKLALRALSAKGVAAARNLLLSPNMVVRRSSQRQMKI